MAGRLLRLLGFILSPVRHIEEAHGWVTFAVQVASLGGLTAVAVAILLSSPEVIIIFVLSVFLLLTFWAAYQLQGKVIKHESRPRPVFVWSAPLVERRGVLGSNRDAPYFAMVNVCNDVKPRHSDATAHDVLARITFYDEEMNALCEIDGRWGDADQPAGLSPVASLQPLKKMTFLPNGEQHELDFVMKYPEEDTMFAYANESQRAPDAKIPSYELRPQSVLVKASLQGQNMDDDEVGWFKITNLGQNNGITIESVPSPSASADTELHTLPAAVLNNARGSG